MSLGTPAKGKARIPEKKQEAAERQQIRAIRTDAEQLQLLIERGHGHCKEARRLKSRIQLGLSGKATVES